MDNLSSKAVVLYGENSFERARELAKLSKLAKKDGFDIERIDGENLASSDMVSLVSGISLLSEKRFIVVKNLSLNAGVWAVLDEFISKISSDIILVIIEDKLDKRTKAFKAISKIADMREFKVLTCRLLVLSLVFTSLFISRLRTILFRQWFRQKLTSFRLFWLSWRLRSESMPLVFLAH
jgi:uncharacterized Fe-S cluster-containing radical SAM superfamily protein